MEVFAFGRSRRFDGRNFQVDHRRPIRCGHGRQLSRQLTASVREWKLGDRRVFETYWTWIGVDGLTTRTNKTTSTGSGHGGSDVCGNGIGRVTYG